MSARLHVRLATRGSALALAQATLVGEALHARGVDVELSIVDTEGDRRAPDTAWGEGAFVAAIERALLDGRAEAAVHSAKDVPTDATPGLAFAAFLPREDPRDALVARRGEPASLESLPSGARVGTDSPRRTAFVLAARPDLRVHALHGNVDTRLRRLDEGATDALVLAAAGLIRLGRSDRIGQALPPELVAPAPGQGALVVQVRADGPRDGEAERRVASAVSGIDHRATRLAVETERAFLAAMGGGCRAPIGALATVHGEHLQLAVAVADVDGTGVQREVALGPLDAPAALVATVVDRLRASGARAGGRGPAARSGPRPRILVTRPDEDAGGLVIALRDVGLSPVVVPAIAIEPVLDIDAVAVLMNDLGPSDWVAVTSRHGASVLLRALAGRDPERPTPRWAAVGAATAEVLRTGGLADVWLPREASGQVLGEELSVAPGDRVLLIRSDLADDALPDALRARGAVVSTAVGYRTREAPSASRALLDAALTDPLDAVVFTSRSTVRGLMALADARARATLAALPAVCIGARTAAVAAEAGFGVVGVAQTADAAAIAAAVTGALDGEGRSDGGT